MLNAKTALVLGDGDGRFCASLLYANPVVRIHAVDSSPAMLKALRSKAVRIHAEHRLTTYLQNVLDTLPQGPFDLVCTHFLLDCLSVDEITLLVNAISERCRKGSWVISEFAIPEGIAKLPATLLIHLLYLAFVLLTGLHVRQLPPYAAVLQRAGFSCVHSRSRLFGILRSELWNMPGAKNANGSD